MDSDLTINSANFSDNIFDDRSLLPTCMTMWSGFSQDYHKKVHTPDIYNRKIFYIDLQFSSELDIS